MILGGSRTAQSHLSFNPPTAAFLRQTRVQCTRHCWVSGGVVCATRFMDLTALSSVRHGLEVLERPATPLYLSGGTFPAQISTIFISLATAQAS